VIRRELYTRPGDTFSKQAVIRSLRNLANLNYFNPEKLQPDVQPVDATTVDLTYQVEEKPSDTFNASVGLSSLGLSGMLGVSFNNFSITEPLTGGAGQILNFNWEFGTYQTTFSLGFTEPWLFDDPTSLGGSVFYQTQDVAEYKLRRYGLTANLGRRLRWPDDYFRIDVGVNALNNKIVGDQSNLAYYQNGSELSLAATISRTSIDNPIFPTSGSRFSFANTIAGLGDARYTKHELKFEFYSPIGRLSESNPVVLYLGNEYGYLNDFGPLDKIPPSAFYSMGGTGLGGFNVTPLRGYTEGSIGPLGPGAIPLGKVYTKVTSELRFGISVNPIPIYALVFAEAGNVWGRFREVDPFDLKRSAGAGLRLTIPGVGLLGFDYGYGFDLDSQGQKGGWQFHFQFGR
jgi:outer membrane protein insertion porin family